MNYFNNHRYDGLPISIIEKIKERGKEVANMELYHVVIFHYKARMEALADEDPSDDMDATKFKRAVPVVYMGLETEAQEKLLKVIQKWRKHGPPPDFQQR